MQEWRKSEDSEQTQRNLEVHRNSSWQARRPHRGAAGCGWCPLHSRSPSDRCYKYLFTSHWIMKPTPRLLQHALRLTLFTHEHCSLCVNVKDVMAKVWDRRHFEYGEVDILAPENQKWKSLYEFDIPVVSLPITAVWEKRVTHAGRFISIELLRCLHGMGN